MFQSRPDLSTRIQHLLAPDMGDGGGNNNVHGASPEMRGPRSPDLMAAARRLQELYDIHGSQSELIACGISSLQKICEAIQKGEIVDPHFLVLWRLQAERIGDDCADLRNELLDIGTSLAPPNFEYQLNDPVGQLRLEKLSPPFTTYLEITASTVRDLYLANLARSPGNSPQSLQPTNPVSMHFLAFQYRNAASKLYEIHSEVGKLLVNMDSLTEIGEPALPFANLVEKRISSYIAISNLFSALADNIEEPELARYELACDFCKRSYVFSLQHPSLPKEFSDHFLPPNVIIPEIGPDISSLVDQYLQQRADPSISEMSFLDVMYYSGESLRSATVLAREQGDKSLDLERSLLEDRRDSLRGLIEIFKKIAVSDYTDRGNLPGLTKVAELLHEGLKMYLDWNGASGTGQACAAKLRRIYADVEDLIEANALSPYAKLVFTGLCTKKFPMPARPRVDR